VEATVAQCPDHQDLVAFLDKRLPTIASQRVREHVETCPRCQSVVKTLGQSVRAAENAATLPVPEEALPASERVRSWSLPKGDPTRYVRLGEIARGGLGRIVRAHDLHLDRQVAIKESLVEGAGHARFTREALITARLQHPAIVPVHEAARWPSGEPYYAMKLVTGRPLDEVIAQARSFDERLALLPNVIAVADAIAYAHGARVIHRDLKPANVLVGAYGETVVIDWGMAKDLGAPDDPTSPSGTGEGSGGLTVSGSVMGTPAYMPPEQAEGKLVNEGADVYALGALLYHVLTGQMPYQGANILTQVLAGPPPPVQARQANIPPDLATIVSRAMARQVSDRYPSARDLAEDLRRFQTGQLVAAHRYSRSTRIRRWLRRQRAPVAVAAVMLAALVTVGVVSLGRILDERSRANRARDDAEALLQYVTGDLLTTLQPVGQVRALDSVTARTLDYFQKLAAEDRGPSSQLHHAAALRRRGEVLLALNQGPLARSTFEGARELAAAHYRRSPNDPWTEELAEAWLGLSDVARSQGDLPSALSAAHEALVVRERLPAPADEPAHRRALATIHLNIGAVLELQGDLSGALASYRQAHDLVRALASREPTDVLSLTVAVESLGHVGDVLELQGELDEALAIFRQLLRDIERLVAAAPDDMRQQLRLGAAWTRVGGILETLRDYAGALDAYRKDLVIAERAVAHDPANLSWRNDLAITWNRVGSVLQSQRDYAGALDAYHKTLAIQEHLSAIDPSNIELLRGVGVVWGWIGTVHEKQRDLPAALEAYRHFEAIHTRLVALDATNIDWRDGLVVARWRLAETLLALGRTAEAQKILHDTVKAEEANVHAHPEMLGRAWGRLHLILGNVEAASGRQEAARQAWTRSVEWLAPIAKDKGAGSVSALTQALLHLGRLDEARPLIENLRREQYEDAELWQIVKAAGL
jgi:tetratricopeptide (TPR) repeat protein